MAHEYYKKSDPELQNLLQEKSAELAAFRFGGAGSKVTNVKAGRNLRREIARIKTILNSRS